MKKLLLLGGMVLASVCASHAVHSESWTHGVNATFANAGVIPDGNVTGWSDPRNVTLVLGRGEAVGIKDVNVNLEITGGYNGDLYAYLVHSSGFAVLLNRSGKTATPLDAFGYGDTGFDVTIDGSGANDIHLYQNFGYPGSLNGNGQLTGTWQEDGRTDDPAIVTESTANRTAFLSSFNGLDGNGSWTLFLADMSGGDTSTLVNWGLDISLVPEPTTWAMIIFGVIAALTSFVRWRRQLIIQRLQPIAVKKSQRGLD